jgi:hypothetical protein
LSRVLVTDIKKIEIKKKNIGLAPSQAQWGLLGLEFESKAVRQ